MEINGADIENAKKNAASTFAEENKALKAQFILTKHLSLQRRWQRQSLTRNDGVVENREETTNHLSGHSPATLFVKEGRTPHYPNSTVRCLGGTR
jgi:hypothetical protein